MRLFYGSDVQRVPVAAGSFTMKLLKIKKKVLIQYQWSGYVNYYRGET